MELNFFSKKPKKVALVLGGGATRGLAHVGAIKALEENNIAFNYVVGTSVGSLVGAAYAAGLKASEIEELAKNIKPKDIRKNFLPFTPSVADGIKDVVKSSLGDVKFSDLKRKLCVVAVDVITSNEVHITKGSVADAVAGSCAVPGVFYPVQFENYRLFDGGLSNNIPSNVAKIVFDCDAVVAIDVNSTRGQGTDSTKYLDQIMASIRIMMKSNSLKGYLNSNIIIQPDLKRFKRTSLNYIDEMIEEGYNATLFQIDNIKALLSGKKIESKPQKLKVRKVKNIF